jgi:hypothetical protein
MPPRHYATISMPPPLPMARRVDADALRVAIARTDFHAAGRRRLRFSQAFAAAIAALTLHFRFTLRQIFFFAAAAADFFHCHATFLRIFVIITLMLCQRIFQALSVYAIGCQLRYASQLLAGH